MKVLPLLVVGVFVAAGAAYVTRAPATPSGCTYETTLMDRGTRAANDVGLAIHSLEEPLSAVLPKISDTVRGTWRTLGFWTGVSGAGIQGRAVPASPPVPCGTDPCAPTPPRQQQPAPQDPASFRSVPAKAGRANTERVAARYWSGRELQRSVAIAGAESSFNPDPPHPPVVHGSTMRGLWQINEHAHLDLFRKHPNWRDPATNAWMAFQVYKQAGNSWHPWTTYTHGSYLRYMRPVSVHASAALAPRPPLNDSLTPQAAAPPQCHSPATPPVSPPGASTRGVRTVRDVTSGTVYRVPIPAGPRGVALNFALDQEAQGDWYKFGAHGPDRWDCSGLVSGAWKAAGYSVYPQTGVLVRQETHVTTAEPGDLLWHPGHVQMFVGIIGGKTIIVEAPHTGSRVRIRPQWMHPTVIMDPTKNGAQSA